MNKINEKAHNEIGELCKKYNAEKCDEKLNQDVTDAFADINPF